MAASDWFSGFAVVISGCSLAVAWWNRKTILMNQKVAQPRVEHWAQQRGQNQVDYRIVTLDIKNDANTLWKINSVRLKAPGYARFSKYVQQADGFGNNAGGEPIGWHQNLELNGMDNFLAKPFDEEIIAIVTICAKSDSAITIENTVTFPVD